MSYLYDEYLYDHIKGVHKAYEWLVGHKIVVPGLELTLNLHDESKKDLSEYGPYDAYFYGNKSRQVVEEFN